MYFSAASCSVSILRAAIIISLLNSAVCQRPIFCSNVCRTVRRVADEDCGVTRFIRKRCHVIPCSFSSGRSGFICAPRPLQSRDPASPSPKPIAIPRGCRDKCYLSRLKAFRDCRYNRRPVAGCHITECELPGKNNRSGWKCAPTTDVPGNVTVFLGEASSFVFTCSDDSVYVRANQSAPFAPGQILWTFPLSSGDFCTDCNFIIRKIISAEDKRSFAGFICPSGAKCQYLTTEKVTVNDLYERPFFTAAAWSAIADKIAEDLIDCGSDTSVRPAITDAIPVRDALVLNNVRVGISIPSTCSNFFQKNSDGRCLYTDCFVGSEGSANDCFVCGTSCDNGCGSEEFEFFPESLPFTFDFTESCCVHDYCYTSTFKKWECDLAFLRDNLRSCVKTGFQSFFIRIYGSCLDWAFGYYLGVVLFGGSSYKESQSAMKGYYETDTCTAKCPTTQESGGQGVTRLRIDMLRKSGTFPVEYEMYTIPDELTITYEGATIFSTGGLVSGSKSQSVSFSGESTIIIVTINAPQSGTEWDIFIGCPQ